ncbi:MAG: hydrogenase nickel incorporation protein HypB [Candidatus Nezhaarchaeota archaeon]|nr:hydrogenase nickel incorporation protein HypB [Candidatus Nezhaarchaeota archaeon]
MAVLEGLSVIDEGGALRQFEGEVLDIEVERDVLEFNRRVALENRRILDERGVRAVDFMGSLGAGKTSLIEALIRRLKEKYRVAVIVGDVASSVDADRISRLGVKAIQVNTGRECHLDAQLVRRALEALNLGEVDLLFIENVGNLICPADFPLGAHSRVVVISVSEGGDMVLKHPLSFRDVDLVVVNKVDVADSFGVKPQDLAEDVRRVNPKANVVLSSVKTGLGIDDVVKALNL